MRSPVLFPLPLVLALAACQAMAPAPAADAPAPAHVTTSHLALDTTRIDTFLVTAIGGRSLGQAGDPATRDNDKDGRYPIASGKPLRIDIEGRAYFLNPLRSLFWNPMRVEGRVEFVPQPDADYVVRGQVDQAGSSVWLENAATHEVIGQKFTN